MRKRPFTAAKFYFNGEYDGDRLLWRFRSFSTLKAAMRGVRINMAELEGDGYKRPTQIVIWHDGATHEPVAIWKRGRFVWVDSVFKKRERDAK